MTRLVLLVVLLALVGLGMSRLRRAHWPERAPRSAIALWQAIGLACAIALIGGAVELVQLSMPGGNPRRRVTDFAASLTTSAAPRAASPVALFALTAGLIVATLIVGALLTRTWAALRTRARHRLLVDLLAEAPEHLAGTLVLPAAEPAAFSLLGRHSRIVLTKGALATLSDDQLAAVLAHERAHVHARHDLVLLPFGALAGLVPWSRSIAAVHREVAALVEMAADDQARRHAGIGALVDALATVGAGAPGGGSESLPAPAQPSSTTARRTARLLRGEHPARWLAPSAGLSAAAVVALPLFVLLAPFGGR